MNEKVFKERTKKLAIGIIQLVEGLPRSVAATAIGRQIVRSGTSIGAKSTADMINKLKIVEEESDETAYWLELIAEMKYLPQGKVEPFLKETNEILAMTVASIKTLRARKSQITNRKS